MASTVFLYFDMTGLYKTFCNLYGNNNEREAQRSFDHLLYKIITSLSCLKFNRLFCFFFSLIQEQLE